jgi:hypothetical protein
MALTREQSANRSPINGYREELQRGHRGEDAFSFFAISRAANRPQAQAESTDDQENTSWEGATLTAEQPRSHARPRLFPN